MLLLKSTASGDRSIVPPRRSKDSYLSAEAPSLSLRIRVLITQILAYMLDSLVRVSRRVNENHFVSIAKPQMASPLQNTLSGPNNTALLSNQENQAGNGALDVVYLFLTPVHRKPHGL